MEDKNSNENTQDKRTISMAIVGGAVIAALVVLSTLWISRSEQAATNETVHSVSSLYLRELTDRREQVINARINVRVDNLRAAMKVISPADLQSVETLSAFLGKMKILYDVDQFAFSNASGVVFTPEGMLFDSTQYFFATLPINASKVFTHDKKVYVAIPVENLVFQGTPIRNCFLELSMSRFLQGILVHTTKSEMTFFNLYYTNGDSLTDAVLGGLSSGTNLLVALTDADFDEGFSYERIKEDFGSSRQGMSSFTYRGVKESLYYRPVGNTGWMLSYLIRENNIQEEIAAVNAEIRQRSMIQMLFTIAAMAVVFWLIISQAKKNQKLIHQKNISDTENRIKREEMEEKFRLQTQLLSEERRRRRQSEMIQALTVDYRLVYHLSLDSDEAVCYRVAPDIGSQLNRKQSDVVKFQAAMASYVQTCVWISFSRKIFAPALPIRKLFRNAT